MARAREEQTPAQAGAQLPAADTTPETDPSPAADVQGAEGSGDAAHRRLFGQIFGRGPEGEDQGQ